jgi:autophagy-related protein 101
VGLKTARVYYSTTSLYPSAILHTIFFHRYFIPIVPLTRDLLDQTLPAIDDVDLETLIDQRATSLVRAIEAPADLPTVHPGGRPSYNTGAKAQSGRAQIAVQFFEKKRKKTYFFGKGDEEVCWEQWTLDVTCATPRTETGMLYL